MAMPYPVKRKHSLLNASKHQKVEVMSDLTKRNIEWLIWGYHYFRKHPYGHFIEKKSLVGMCVLVVFCCFKLEYSDLARASPSCNPYDP